MGLTTWGIVLTTDNVLTVGTVIHWPGPAQSATLRNLACGLEDYLVKFPPLDPGNSGFFLKSARITCNFADGLVTKYDPVSPSQLGLGTWAIWIGEPATPPDHPTYTPDTYLNVGIGPVWNEWREINQPIPRPLPVANARPMVTLVSGGTDFMTDTIDSVYNGKRVFMSLELLIETNFIQYA